MEMKFLEDVILYKKRQLQGMNCVRYIICKGNDQRKIILEWTNILGRFENYTFNEITGQYYSGGRNEISQARSIYTCLLYTSIYTF